MFRTPSVRLVVLTLLHFTVDFYAGLLTPLLEPTLTNHFGVSLAAATYLFAVFLLVVNWIQPGAGLVLPRRGAPVLLVIGPVVAASMTCLGLVHTYAAAMGIIVVSAIGNGLVHPEALLASHAISGTRQGLGISIFLSGGHFGLGLGNWVSAEWASRHGLAGFWILGLGAVVTAVLVLGCGLHRTKAVPHTEPADHEHHGLRFGPVFVLGASIATTSTLITVFLTPFLVQGFGDPAQRWGGRALLAYGLANVSASYLWGHLSDRWGRARTVAVAQTLSLPLLVGLTEAASPHTAPLWAAGVGATLTSVFPITVVLARGARGLSARPRAALAIGGAWGVCVPLLFFAGWLTDLLPVQWILRAVAPAAAATALWAVLLARHEQHTTGGARSGAPRS